MEELVSAIIFFSLVSGAGNFLGLGIHSFLAIRIFSQIFHSSSLNDQMVHPLRILTHKIFIKKRVG